MAKKMDFINAAELLELCKKRKKKIMVVGIQHCFKN